MLTVETQAVKYNIVSRGVRVGVDEATDLVRSCELTASSAIQSRMLIFSRIAPLTVSQNIIAHEMSVSRPLSRKCTGA